MNYLKLRIKNSTTKRKKNKNCSYLIIFYVPFPAHWRSLPTATEASKMWV